MRSVVRAIERVGPDTWQFECWTGDRTVIEAEVEPIKISKGSFYVGDFFWRSESGYGNVRNYWFAKLTPIPAPQDAFGMLMLVRRILTLEGQRAESKIDAVLEAMNLWLMR